MRLAAAADEGNEGRQEFLRLHSKKFKTTPELFSPTRTFVSKSSLCALLTARWTFGLVKSRKSKGKDDDKFVLSPCTLLLSHFTTVIIIYQFFFNDIEYR